MDRLTIDARLEALQRCITRIESRRVQSADALRVDIDRQDILSLNLTRAVQLCVDIAMHLAADRDLPTTGTMGSAFIALAEAAVIDAALAERLRAAVGFRNIAVHRYSDIDWAIVHHITHEGLDDFRAFARAVSANQDSD
jgi:uncharacterized protein YutE (UPF0331/DUF86 family)